MNRQVQVFSILSNFIAPVGYIARWVLFFACQRKRHTVKFAVRTTGRLGTSGFISVHAHHASHSGWGEIKGGKKYKPNTSTALHRRLHAFFAPPRNWWYLSGCTRCVPGGLRLIEAPNRSASGQKGQSRYSVSYDAVL